MEKMEKKTRIAFKMSGQSGRALHSKIIHLCCSNLIIALFTSPFKVRLCRLTNNYITFQISFDNFMEV